MRWAKAYAYPLIYLVLCIGLAGYILIGLAFSRPYHAKSLLQRAILLAGALSSLALVIEALQLFTGRHDPSWTFGQYLWNLRTSGAFYSLCVDMDGENAVLAMGDTGLQVTQRFFQGTQR